MYRINLCTSEYGICFHQVRAEDDNNDNDQKAMMAALQEDDVSDDLDQKDGGYIELVLRVLARMCDGQHIGLQVCKFTLYSACP